MAVRGFNFTHPSPRKSTNAGSARPWTRSKRRPWTALENSELNYPSSHFHPHFASSREAPHAPLVFARPPTTNDESLLAFCRLALRVCALADATALLVEVA